MAVSFLQKEKYKAENYEGLQIFNVVEKCSRKVDKYGLCFSNISTYRQR